jgi:hypothetical protein
MSYPPRFVMVVAALVCVAAQPLRTRPVASLEPASQLSFPAPTDSNSPAFWRMRRGVSTLSVLNSTGAPILATGAAIDDINVLGPAALNDPIAGGWWMEAVVPDHRGVLYGYYHNEQTDVCTGSEKAAPRIGAARSFDGGRTWSDLGFILEAVPGSENCQTLNRYFVGGVGDFSVILDQDRKYLYLFFSAYVSEVGDQGVAVGRMRWSDRDRPAGQVSVWDDGVWRYPQAEENDRWIHAAARPIFPASRSWHGRNADAFWGPSVHWNTHLEKYVMLLNRARDSEFRQEGIYLSLSESLENPREWPSPYQILAGRKWYPQVIGLEAGTGTDKLAGRRARLFIGGVSEHEIVFQRPDEVAAPR